MGKKGVRMKHLLNEEKSKIFSNSESKTSCVAWFKLSELITRKEKEKALSLYRLLSHSLEDKAYALQVEGDILWSLEDKDALEKYTQAAYLYKKEKNLASATAVYEHLLTLQPHEFDYLSKLIIFYALLSWTEKFEERYLLLLDEFDQGMARLDQVFDLSKRVIDFITGVGQLKEREEGDDFLEKKDRKKEFDWILKSLFSILKKRNSDLHEKIKEYCSEFKLNFNS